MIRSWRFKQFIARLAFRLLFSSENRKYLMATVHGVANDPRIPIYNGARGGREARRDEASYRASQIVNGIGQSEMNLGLELAHFISKREPAPVKHPQRVA